MKIAIIDDNSTILKTIEAVLMQSGCVRSEDAIETYKNGEDFLKSYYASKDGTHKIVICDYNLGDSHASGYETITAIQKSGFNGIAVLLTGDDSEDMALRMKLTVGIEYLLKGDANMMERIIHYVKKAGSE